MLQVVHWNWGVGNRSVNADSSREKPNATRQDAESLALTLSFTGGGVREIKQETVDGATETNLWIIGGELDDELDVVYLEEVTEH